MAAADSPLTTHVLDTSRGCAASGLPITVFKQHGSEWQRLTENRYVEQYICILKYLFVIFNVLHEQVIIVYYCISLIVGAHKHCTDNVFCGCFRATNADGRCPELLTSQQFTAGVYKITFDTSTYFKKIGVKGFYPYVDVSTQRLVHTQL